MSASQRPIHAQIIEHRKVWQDLWWGMAGGDATAYREIKKMDVLEFYSFFDKWREKNERDAEIIKKRNQNGR